jgi:hypothetical protein
MRVKGTIEHPDGTISEFQVDADDDGSAGYMQWGADTKYLGRSVRLLESLSEGLAVMFEEEQA